MQMLVDQLYALCPSLGYGTEIAIIVLAVIGAIDASWSGTKNTYFLSRLVLRAIGRAAPAKLKKTATALQAASPEPAVGKYDHFSVLARRLMFAIAGAKLEENHLGFQMLTHAPLTVRFGDGEYGTFFMDQENITERLSAEERKSLLERAVARKDHLVAVANQQEIERLAEKITPLHHWPLYRSNGDGEMVKVDEDLPRW